MRKLFNPIHFMITIDTSKIERVILTPMTPSMCFKIVPAHTITKGFWLCKKVINIDTAVQSLFSGHSRTIDEFIESEDEMTVINNTVYDKPNVVISLASGGYAQRYFNTDSDAVKFYDSVVGKIGHKISYA